MLTNSSSANGHRGRSLSSCFGLVGVETPSRHHGRRDVEPIVSWAAPAAASAARRIGLDPDLHLEIADVPLLLDELGVREERDVASLPRLSRGASFDDVGALLPAESARQLANAAAGGRRALTRNTSTPRSALSIAALSPAIPAPRRPALFLRRHRIDSNGSAQSAFRPRRARGRSLCRWRLPLSSECAHEHCSLTLTWTYWNRIHAEALPRRGRSSRKLRRARANGHDHPVELLLCDVLRSSPAASALRSR